MLRGRQMVWLALQWNKLNDEAGAYYSFTDLMKVKLSGNNLQAFMILWDTTIAKMQKVPDQDVLQEVFFEQLEHCSALSHEMAQYRLKPVGHEERSYSWLRFVVQQNIERKRFKDNRESWTRGVSGVPTVPVLPQDDPKKKKDFFLEIIGQIQLH